MTQIRPSTQISQDGASADDVLTWDGGGWVPAAAPGGGSLTVDDEGVSQGTASTFDFTGAGVTASVSGGVATIDIPGLSAGAANWQAPSYVNSWTNVGGGSATKYRLNDAGQVEIQFASQSGGAAALAFTLPTGYRPGQLIDIPCLLFDTSTTSFSLGIANVSTAGLVQILTPTAGIPASGRQVYGTVVFFAEN